MKIPSKTYDWLKWVCMIALPAIATCFGVLASIWGWELSEQIVASITAVNTCIGALIGISTYHYNRDEGE